MYAVCLLVSVYLIQSNTTSKVSIITAFHGTQVVAACLEEGASWFVMALGFERTPAIGAKQLTLSYVYFLLRGCAA
jgi:hypothetical protein